MMRDRTTAVKATVGSVSTKASLKTRTKGMGLDKTLEEILVSGDDVATYRNRYSYFSTDVMLNQYTTTMSRVSGALT
jgi:hypothetical protein